MGNDNNTRESSNYVVVGFLFPNLLLRLLGLILLAHGHMVSKKGSQPDPILVCLSPEYSANVFNSSGGRWRSLVVGGGFCFSLLSCSTLNDSLPERPGCALG